MGDEKINVKGGKKGEGENAWKCIQNTMREEGNAPMRETESVLVGGKEQCRGMSHDLRATGRGSAHQERL